jgi:hypothetical protein
VVFVTVPTTSGSDRYSLDEVFNGEEFESSEQRTGMDPRSNDALRWRRVRRSLLCHEDSLPFLFAASALFQLDPSSLCEIPFFQVLIRKGFLRSLNGGNLPPLMMKYTDV